MTTIFFGAEQFSSGPPEGLKLPQIPEGKPDKQGKK
jgi:hypothetical protein